MPHASPPGLRRFPVLLHFRASRTDGELLAAICRETQQTPAVVLRALLGQLRQLDAWDLVRGGERETGRRERD